MGHRIPSQRSHAADAVEGAEEAMTPADVPDQRMPKMEQGVHGA
jgi:hypothetical protein